MNTGTLDIKIGIFITMLISRTSDTGILMTSIVIISMISIIAILHHFDIMEIISSTMISSLGITIAMLLLIIFLFRSADTGPVTIAAIAGPAMTT